MANGGSDAPSGGFVQLLTPDGERLEKATTDDGVTYSADFTDDEYRQFYRDMVTVRRLDAEGLALQRQGELGLWASLVGQEAAQVGSGRAMRPRDMVFPSYREHGVLYTRGIDPVMPFSLYRGVDQGGWDADEYRFNGYTLVVGAQTLHATGYAMGITMDGKVGTPDAEAVTVYFGDGATSQGEVNEAFVWAARFDAPLVFFCQNNQYAISMQVEQQTRVPLHRRAAGYGFPGVRIDGNDVLASYAVTRAALDDARNGLGPTLIEAYTYRMGAHTSSDDPTRYRVTSEVESWKAKDPISRLKTFLTKQQIAGDDFFGEVDESARKLALELRDKVLEMPDPKPVSMFEHAYPHGSPDVDAQRAGFTTYHASFEGGDH